MKAMEELVLEELRDAGFDGQSFIEDLEAVCESRRKLGKTSRKIDMTCI